MLVTGRPAASEHIVLLSAVCYNDTLTVWSAHPGALDARIVFPDLLSGGAATGSAPVCAINRVLGEVHVLPRMADGLLVGFQHIARVGQYRLLVLLIALNDQWPVKDISLRLTVHIQFNF